MSALSTFCSFPDRKRLSEGREGNRKVTCVAKGSYVTCVAKGSYVTCVAKGSNVTCVAKGSNVTCVAKGNNVTGVAEENFVNFDLNFFDNKLKTQLDFSSYIGYYRIENANVTNLVKSRVV